MSSLSSSQPTLFSYSSSNFFPNNSSYSFPLSTSTFIPLSTSVLFLEPVDEEKYPDYYKDIKNPVGLIVMN
jgi:hypothetical protein